MAFECHPLSVAWDYSGHDLFDGDASDDLLDSEPVQVCEHLVTRQAIFRHDPAEETHMRDVVLIEIHPLPPRDSPTFCH